MRLSSEDVAVMRAAAMLFPAFLPAPADSLAATIRTPPLPAEGLMLIEELKLLAMDHAAVADGPGQARFADAVEETTLLEQSARAMTIPCGAALGVLPADAPDWIGAILRQGADRLARYARLTSAQRLRLSAIDPRMVGAGVDLE
jgi:hypothetical protein